jgi:hypothetical protein
VQIAAGLVVALIVGGPTVVVIKNSASSSSSGRRPPTTNTPHTVVTGVRLLKELTAAGGEPDIKDSFPVGGHALVNAVGIDASRGASKELDYSIDGEYSSLSTTIGVTDGFYGNYTFQILTDGNPQFSRRLASGDQVDVPPVNLTGATKLSLIVTTADGPYGPGGATGVFANAKLSP